MKPILEQGNICGAGINKVQRFSNLNLNKYFQYGLVAQLVAQLLCKQKVTGSRPVSSTTHSCYPMRLKLPKEHAKLLAWAHVPTFMVMAMSDNGKTPVPVCRLSDRNLWQDQPVTDPIPLRVKKSCQCESLTLRNRHCSYLNF